MPLLDHIFPPQCILCSRVGYEICDYCLLHIPKALPACCVCKRISTNGVTHKGCSFSDIPILSIKGWNIGDKYLRELEKKKVLNIYSIYRYLLFKLIKYSKLEGMISKSVIYPIHSKSKEAFNLNRYLATSLSKERGKGRIILVGETLESIDILKKEIENIKRKSIKEVVLITLF
ncbi:MAG: hypothetical protein RBT33_00270 [Candidatus Dojkabacteria bacterium]|jgi:hypothetical protein|nr:hypothetical protein [Candidatus Dojkabacteria bacterium]